jgi:hypothetical protein
MRLLALTLLLAAAPIRPMRVAAPADPVDRRRDAIARDLMRIGADLRRDVAARDVEAILARVPQAGLRCGGRVIPRAKVARDLRSESSWIHGALFGGPGYAARPGAPPSLAAFLRSVREIAIVVTFQEGGAAGPEGRPCIDFRAEGAATPGVPFCFERRGDRWWLVDSLYPCW